MVEMDAPVAIEKKGIAGKTVVLFKHFARKVVAWCVNPVCDAKTRYNTSITEAMDVLLKTSDKDGN